MRTAYRFFCFLLVGLICYPALAVAADPSDYLGRWDLTVRDGNRDRPSWIEVKQAQGGLAVDFVGFTGSAHPVNALAIKEGRLTFSTGGMSFDLGLEKGALAGTATRRTSSLAVSGKRAPRMIPSGEPQWGEPVQLFNGKDLAGWHHENPGASTWSVTDGVLSKTGQGGSNLITDREFGDFKLHLEFNVPPGANSGVYLRGRYEVQVEDDEQKSPRNCQMAAIYGFLAPEVEMPRRPGEWQTFDITLRGRIITTVHNGTVVIREREIPGITGGAINSDEGNPGPIYLQGDHGTVQYRNIVITPAR